MLARRLKTQRLPVFLPRWVSIRRIETMISSGTPYWAAISSRTALFSVIYDLGPGDGPAGQVAPAERRSSVPRPGNPRSSVLLRIRVFNFPAIASGSKRTSGRAKSDSIACRLNPSAASRSISGVQSAAAAKAGLITTSRSTAKIRTGMQDQPNGPGGSAPERIGCVRAGMVSLVTVDVPGYQLYCSG